MLYNCYISTNPGVWSAKFTSALKPNGRLPKQNKKTPLSLVEDSWFLYMPTFILLCHWAVLAEKLEKPWFGCFLQGFHQRGHSFQTTGWLICWWKQASSFSAYCVGTWKWHKAPASGKGQKRLWGSSATGSLRQPPGSLNSQQWQRRIDHTLIIYFNAHSHVR